MIIFRKMSTQEMMAKGIVQTWYVNARFFLVGAGLALAELGNAGIL